jgi:phage N-6-adenine-methyltransferase
MDARNVRSSGQAVTALFFARLLGCRGGSVSALGAALEDPRQCWKTPRQLFSALHERFSFDVDAAADDSNHLLPHYWTVREDGIAQLEARGNDALRAFVNPPGAAIYPWVEAARYRWVRGALTVLLLPSRTDSAWFHEHARCGQVFFSRGRVSYEPADGANESKNSAGSVLVVFDPEIEMQGCRAFDADTGAIL